MEVIQTVAQYAGLPGLIILYFIIARQRNQDKSDSEGQESAMNVRVEKLEEEIKNIKSDRKDDNLRTDGRFKDLEAKVDSNYKEISEKLDRMNENTNQGLNSIKDVLSDMRKDIAVLNYKKDEESK